MFVPVPSTHNVRDLHRVIRSTESSRPLYTYLPTYLPDDLQVLTVKYPSEVCWDEDRHGVDGAGGAGGADAGGGGIGGSCDAEVVVCATNRLAGPGDDANVNFTFEVSRERGMVGGGGGGGMSVSFGGIGSSTIERADDVICSLRTCSAFCSSLVLFCTQDAARVVSHRALV